LRTPWNPQQIQGDQYLLNQLGFATCYLSSHKFRRIFQ